MKKNSLGPIKPTPIIDDNALFLKALGLNIVEWEPIANKRKGTIRLNRTNDGYNMDLSDSDIPLLSVQARGMLLEELINEGLM